MSDRICSTCPRPYASFVSEIVDIKVRPHRRIIHQNRYRKSSSCPQEKGIKTALPPPRLITKGKIGLSVWTEVMLFKYAHHLPLSRILDSWKDRGLSLSARMITPLFRPLYEAIAERGRTASFSQRTRPGTTLSIYHARTSGPGSP